MNAVPSIFPNGLPLTVCISAICFMVHALTCGLALSCNLKTEFRSVLRDEINFFEDGITKLSLKLYLVFSTNYSQTTIIMGI